MVRKGYPVFIFLIVAVSISAIILFLPTEEKRVKKVFSLLSELVSKDSGESPIAMAKKVRSLGELFDQNCHFIVSDYSLQGDYAREEISGIALRARARFEQLSLKFYDLKISFPEKDVAQVYLTARLKGKSVNGEFLDETRELVCFLKRGEKKWIFSRVEVIEVLKR